MSTPTPGRTWVDSAPPIEPYRYGLFSVATFKEGIGPWQVRGVEYFTDGCAQGGYVIGSCPQPVPPPDDTAQITATPTGTGVTLVSAPGADMPVNYSFTPAVGDPVWGTLAVGQTLPIALPDGTYTYGTQAIGGDLTTRPITIPGPPVVVTVTRDGPPSGETTHDKPVAQGPELAEGSDPFTVYARSECSAVGYEDPPGDARRRLALIEEREAEKFFSRYVLGAPDPALPGDGPDPMPLKRALGVLEQYASQSYAGAPTFHAPRWTSGYFDDRSLLQPPADTGTERRTRLSSRIAFGGSYLDDPFTPETPAAADTFWLVATGSVRGWRSEAFVNETFTPTNNLRMAIAERTYALDADCFRAAVLVTVGGED